MLPPGALWLFTGTGLCFVSHSLVKLCFNQHYSFWQLCYFVPGRKAHASLQASIQMTLIPSDMLAIQTAIDAYEKKMQIRGELDGCKSRAIVTSLT
jgi:hypothetical protein